MAVLPFHYFLALREEWISENTVGPDPDKLASTDDVIEFNAETFKGESV